MQKTSSLRANLEELFGIDLRSLALFRIALAVILLYDLISRASDLTAHYTDYGVLPRSALLTNESFGNLWYVSFHLANGTILFQSFLLTVAGLLALALLFGYRTRLVSFLSWLFLISLHSRNGMVLQGGDVLLRMLVFWGMLLPLGATYSVDEALNNSEPSKPQRVLSIASLGLLLQVCFVYWFTAALKTGAPWWSEGTAVYNALSIDQFATPLGLYLLQHPDFLKFLTHFTIWLEILGPSLAFIPFYTQKIRIFIVALMISLHIGFALGMELGPFPYISSASWLVFLPSEFWDRLLKGLRKPERENLKIYYDAPCGFCRKSVLLFRTFFLIPQTQILTAQEDPSILRKMEEKQSWVVSDGEGKQYFKFAAWTYLCSQSPLLWPLSYVMRLKPIHFLGDKVYDFVASHRMNFGALFSWLKFRSNDLKISNWNQIFAAFALIYILLWNLRTTDFNRFEVILPRSTNWVGNLLRIDQYWSMFSPRPLTEDGWYVIVGKLKDQSEVDLFKNGAAVSWEKPKLVSHTYKDERWRKYMMNLWMSKNAAHRPYYANYLCRSWNLSHPKNKAVEKLTIYFMREDTLPYPQIPQARKVQVYAHDCGKKI